MRRVLLIDRDRSSAEALASISLHEGVASRTVETLCEGVRYLLEAPVSLILVDAGLIRLSPGEQARLFDAVAPEVPVVVLVQPNTPLEEHVRFEVEGFHVVARPVDMAEVLIKMAGDGRLAPARPGAAGWVRSLCG